jgi:RimJ/RimL family protein N-acetyltransferase
MRVVDYYTDGSQEYWLNQIKRSDWGAGQYLYELIRNDQLKELCGNSTRVLLLTEDKQLISFCTYAEQDDIREPSLTPWVGFVYTFPEFRGKRYMGILLNRAYALAKADGYAHIHISTCETGLYEKYGYCFWKMMKDIHGEDSRVYRIDVTEIKEILCTERLFLREMTMDDYAALYAVLSNPDIMQHYPYSFDENRVRGWIRRNRERYEENGFGLWAVCLRDTGSVIGDCGLTLQSIDGETLPEIGYHIHKDHQRKGYAREAAEAVCSWAFQNTDFPALYSYCKYTNVASIRTAEAIGMHFDREYPDDANGITHVSVIYRTDITE